MTARLVALLTLAATLVACTDDTGPGTGTGQDATASDASDVTAQPDNVPPTDIVIPDIPLADVPPPPAPEETAVVEGEHYDADSNSQVLTAADASGVMAQLLASASETAAGRVTWNATVARYTLRTTGIGPHSLCARMASANADGPIGLSVSGASERLEAPEPAAEWAWYCIPYNVTSPVNTVAFSYWNGDAMIDRVALVRPPGSAPQGMGPAAEPSCGNGVCQAGEECGSCGDCCPVSCGDGTCHAEETCASCADDCGACGTSYTGLCHGVEDVVALPPGHWCMVPGSNASAVEKLPAAWDDYDGTSSASFDSYQRVVGFRAIMSAWGGAAMDRTRDRLICFGGGHNDYGGNELLAFDMHSLTWSRVAEPTAFPNRAPDVANPDGTPVSRHTYDGLAYIDHLDSYFVLGGAPDHGPGVCGSNAIFTYDLGAREAAGSYATSQWTQHAVTGDLDSYCEDNAVYDPVTQRVLYHSLNTWSAYDPAAETWTVLGQHPGPDSASATLTGRRTLIETGGGLDGVRRFDVDSATLAGEDVVTSGDKSIESAVNPGLAYDPHADVVIGWNGGADIYVLDLDSNAWSLQASLPTNLASPGPVTASGGTYGRFAYSPNLNAYVVVNTTTSNVFIYRHAAP